MKKDCRVKVDKKIGTIDKATRETLRFLEVGIESIKGKLMALVDTGAEISLLNTKLLSESFLEEKEGCETLRTVSGEEIKTYGKLRLVLKTGDFKRKLTFRVIVMNEDVILGADWIQSMKARIDFDRDLLISRWFGLSFRLVKSEVQIPRVHGISSDDATGLPVEIPQILESYKHVFDEPSKARIDPIKFWPKDDAVI
jgi:hypothetical protein